MNRAHAITLYHFTTLENAEQIVSSGELILNSNSNLGPLYREAPPGLNVAWLTESDDPESQPWCTDPKFLEACVRVDVKRSSVHHWHTLANKCAIRGYLSSLRSDLIEDRPDIGERVFECSQDWWVSFDPVTVSALPKAA